MKIWFMRHGESEANLAGLWTGQLDVPLTEKGRAQAVAAGRIFEGIKFDRIYSSDLSRARETAELAIPDCRYETSVLLREMDVGSVAGKPASVMTPEERLAIRRDGFAKYGGESMEEFKARVLAFKELLEGEECENIAVFSHSGWIRRFFSLAVGMEFPTGKIACGNCASAVYELKNGEWLLCNWNGTVQI